MVDRLWTTLVFQMLLNQNDSQLSVETSRVCSLLSQSDKRKFSWHRIIVTFWVACVFAVRAVSCVVSQVMWSFASFSLVSATDSSTSSLSQRPGPKLSFTAERSTPISPPSPAKMKLWRLNGWWGVKNSGSDSSGSGSGLILEQVNQPSQTGAQASLVWGSV